MYIIQAKNALKRNSNFKLFTHKHIGSKKKKTLLYLSHSINNQVPQFIIRQSHTDENINNRLYVICNSNKNKLHFKCPYYV